MKRPSGQPRWWLILDALFWIGMTAISSQHATASSVSSHFLSPLSPSSLIPTPFFRNPVVPNAQVSGYLDHNGVYPVNSNHLVTFHNGRQNASSVYGYTFSCPELGLDDWVACEGPYSSEATCPDSQELWYDGHTGTDFEYAANWHETGSTCNRSRFAGITRPVYAPAAGMIQLIQTNNVFNGNAIFIKHDLDGDGNYDDDPIRSAYLHFADGSIAVSQGQTIAKGQYLGLGGMTGKAYTPHLHFEVQRSTDPSFVTDKWSVDPFGWTGSGSDPWPYANYPLWYYGAFLPVVFKVYLLPACSEDASLIQNGDFEQGNTIWTEQTLLPYTTIIRNSNLPASPYSGSWVAWLAGYHNANDVLRQSFIVPSNVSSASLIWHVWIYSEEGTAYAWDHLRLRIYDSNRGLLFDLGEVNNTDTRDAWLEKTVPFLGLNTQAGAVWQISFEASANGSNITHFVVDDVSFVTHCGSATGDPLRVMPMQGVVVRNAQPSGPVGIKPQPAHGIVHIEPLR